MLKVKNREIKIVGYKDNKIVSEQVVKNRLLDNYLDYIIWNMLPTATANAVLAKFTSNTGTFIPMEFSYLAFDTTQTIADGDTTMTYDIQSDSTFYYDVSEVISDNGKSLKVNYFFDTSAIGAGSSFNGIGFGRDDGTPSDYLLAFIDLSLLDIDLVDDVEYRFLRTDEILTNETVMNGDTAEYLAGLRSDKLYSIQFASNLNGEGELSTEYLVDDLTFAYISAGRVEVSDFETYFVEDSMYPRLDLYPDTDIYPMSFEKYRSVILKYDGSESGHRISTYINMIDLDVSYDGDTIKIYLVCERGD